VVCTSRSIPWRSDSYSTREHIGTKSECPTPRLEKALYIVDLIENSVQIQALLTPLSLPRSPKSGSRYQDALPRDAEGDAKMHLLHRFRWYGSWSRSGSMERLMTGQAQLPYRTVCGPHLGQLTFAHHSR